MVAVPSGSMRQLIGIGGEIDVVTPVEMKAALDPIARQLESVNKPPLKMWLPPKLYVVAANQLAAPAAVQSATYKHVAEVPPGQRWDILRLTVWSPGYTPAAPSTAGFIQFHVDSTATPPIAWLPEAAGGWVAPAVWSDTDDAPELKQGSKIEVSSGGLTNGDEYVVRIMIRQWNDPDTRWRDKRTG